MAETMGDTDICHANEVELNHSRFEVNLKYCNQLFDDKSMENERYGLVVNVSRKHTHKHTYIFIYHHFFGGHSHFTIKVTMVTMAYQGMGAKMRTPFNFFHFHTALGKDFAK